MEDNKMSVTPPEKLPPDYRVPDQKPPKLETPRGPNLLNAMLVLFLITFMFNTFFASGARNAMTIEYSQMLELVDKNQVERAEITDELISLTLRSDADIEVVKGVLYPEGFNPNRDPSIQLNRPLVSVPIDNPGLIDRLSDKGISFYKPLERTKTSPLMAFFSSWLVPILLMYLAYSFFMKRLRSSNSSGMGGMFGTGKSKVKQYVHEKETGVSFRDVAGQEEAKDSLMEMVDFLKNPAKYHSIGAKQPKGALLVGPPGTGKTLLAKAVAGESGVPFFSISGSEFIEMFVGVGAKRVRDLFEQAKAQAPCIIFIDEIDAIGKSRNNQFGGNDEREQTLNQLLAEMDGFDVRKGIIVLAATNRPEILDKALLRPGRFDRRIIVESPDLAGRQAILEVHAKKIKLALDIDLRQIALATSGATGADLANIVNEAALLAVKHGDTVVHQAQLMEAVEVIIAGKEKKDRIMNTKEREMVAYHEVGHALVSALQTKKQPVQKITIVPRTMGSLGYTISAPQEERFLMTKSELQAQIATLLGGRAAEIVKYGEVTTGASNDIERATALARSMVTRYGMSDAFGPMGLEKVTDQYLDGNTVSTSSSQSQARIDDEVKSILEEAQTTAIKLIEHYRDKLETITDHLLEKENISGETFLQLLDLPA